MSGPPPHSDYDPRRLFPFGLSPIPEVPSELASEVSSVYSYYEEEDEEEVGSEEEEEEQQRSIMYSGSCSSVKSNRTLDHVDVDVDDAVASDDDDDDTEEEDDTDEVDEDDDDDDTEVENLAVDGGLEKAPAVAASEVQDVEEHYNSLVTHVMHQRAFTSSTSTEEEGTGTAEEVIDVTYFTQLKPLTTLSYHCLFNY